ncbi:MAG: FecR family protein [Humidesulfovibrio sp.]|uniref:FecR family protein n=1 Tax=Humidesulfovibrio sp. TaxID=2910988 RepID=UPI0027FD55CE|nr:FecR family protein [Humidesulfovibrio sp.]MDQ7833840.1 FecR family protein [Humidesulfovibrio sp.]
MNNYYLRAPFRVLFLTVALALSSGFALASEPDNPVGSVKSIEGHPMVTRGAAAPKPLAPGQRIYEKDVLTTGATETLGLIMRDNSLLSLGPNTKLVVERFLFAPEKGALASILRVAKGSSAVVTGEIAKLSPKAMQIHTPTSTIGIRGTHFLVNVEEGAEAAPTEPAPTEAGGR